MATAAPAPDRSALPFLPRRTLGRIVLPLAGLFFLLMIWVPVLETFYLSLFRKEPGEFYFIGLTREAGQRLPQDPPDVVVADLGGLQGPPRVADAGRLGRDERPKVER